MEKAYDLKELEKKAKAAGLPEVEELAEKLYGAVKEWIVESAKVSPTPYDDLGIPFINYVDAIVMPKIDEIDGVEG